MGNPSRGIQIVEWKNKHTRGTQRRYRVRINRADFKTDQLFESLADAESFLAASKTRDGQLGLTEREVRAKAFEEAFVETMENRPLSDYIERYIDTHIGNEPLAHPTKERSRLTNISRLRGCAQTRLDWKNRKLMAKPGMLALHPELARFARDKTLVAAIKPLGDFLIAEVDASVATNFIRARLTAGCAKSTVKREVGALQTVFNKLRFLDPEAWRRMPDRENPFAGADKSLLEGHKRRVRRRLSPEEEAALFRVLGGMRRKAMLQIVALAMTTSMRRGECLFLRWSQVKETYIQLEAEETKSGEDRRVLLSKDAKAVLASIERVPGRDRLFDYTADGFKTNFARALKKAGIADYRFHLLRHESISRAIENLADPSAVMLSQLTGMKSTRHLQEQYIDPHAEDEIAKRGQITSVAALMKSVGHADMQTLNHYTNLLADKGRSG